MLDLRNGADNDDRVVTDETYADRIAEGCHMMGVRLTRVTFIRCGLYWSLWFLADLTEVVFDQCDLRGAAFNDATLTRCSFIDTDVGTDALGGLTDWGMLIFRPRRSFVAAADSLGYAFCVNMRDCRTTTNCTFATDWPLAADLTRRRSPRDFQRYPTDCMRAWLYTLRERLTSDMRERFDRYRQFSGFAHIAELVTLDSMMCPSLIADLRDEDWDHNVQEDFRTELFRDADYLLRRQPLGPTKHQLIA